LKENPPLTLRQLSPGLTIYRLSAIGVDNPALAIKNSTKAGLLLAHQSSQTPQGLSTPAGWFFFKLGCLA
jgi:hypothetical protein